MDTVQRAFPRLATLTARLLERNRTASAERGRVMRELAAIASESASARTRGDHQRLPPGPPPSTPPRPRAAAIGRTPPVDGGMSVIAGWDEDGAARLAVVLLATFGS